MERGGLTCLRQPAVFAADAGALNNQAEPLQQAPQGRR
jgi:hypothetical protein